LRSSPAFLACALGRSAGGVVGQDIADVRTEVITVGVGLDGKIVAQCWF
jgi:hypothetical protein